MLSHTYNPEVISGARLNGSYVGESGINALVAHRHAVPLALITGDAVTIAEVRGVAPDAVTVTSKESITRFAAHNLHPERSRELIRDGAERAVAAVRSGEIRPPRIDFPARLDVEFQTADMAEVGSWVKGAERSGIRSVSIEGDDGAAMYAAFVALSYITRQAGGR